MNLIGVDYQSRVPFGPAREGIVKQYLDGVEPLILPGAVNILFSHNPNTFDRAAELGIDLSLAGHTHGGQITLEYISPDLSPARLITPTCAAGFKKATRNSTSTAASEPSSRPSASVHPRKSRCTN